MEILVIPSAKSKREKVDPASLDFPTSEQILYEDVEAVFKGKEAQYYLKAKRPQIEKRVMNSASWSGSIGKRD